VRIAPSDDRMTRILLCCVMGCMIIHAMSGSAQSRDARAVRVAYLFNLIQFVTWPPEKHDLLIGVVGDRTIDEMIRTLLDGKIVDGKIIHVVPSPADDDIRRCSIVYFGEAHSSRSKAVLADVKNLSILTVGEADSFARDGGIVGLVKDDDHIEIQVNLDAAQRARISISSRVLNLAVIMRPGHGGKS
jgi:YfiR/HmsC-like